MVVWLNEIVKVEFRKVGLTHLDNAVGGQFTLSCIHLSRPSTGQVLRTWSTVPVVAFDPDVKQHKFVEESWG